MSRLFLPRDRRVVVLAFLLLAGACSETTRSSRTGADRTTNNAGASANEAPRPSSPNGDVRVVLHQPAATTRTGVVPEFWMVLVNEGHHLRDTEQGRVAVALGDPNRGYKVMTEEQAANLLTSLEQAGWTKAALPVTADDEGYLKGASPGSSERYKGIIVVESPAGRFSLRGQRASGETDVAGQQRLKQFIDLKNLISAFYQGTVGEMPIGSTPKPIQVPDRK